jgi:hypothetical protein
MSAERNCSKIFSVSKELNVSYQQSSLNTFLPARNPRHVACCQQLARVFMDLYKIDNTPPAAELPEGMEAIISFRRELNPPKFVNFALDFYERSCNMVSEVCSLLLMFTSIIYF